MVDSTVQCEDVMPEWLDGLLEKTFFGRCGSHDLQKNDLNRYCITCDSSNCKYCIASGSHNEHKLLTIYRHIYQDVVPLKEIEIHLDCSKIQPYKCNKKWVVSLKPLPHNGSGLHMDGDEACDVCKRKLNDYDRYRFCCLACKVQAFHEMNKSRVAMRTLTERMDKVEQTTNPNNRKRSRKGVPCRAPFF
ncbi:PLATZ transcription factor family protein [Forsythia ovata]|uniref:PLATZ transcription factor family protein n=1 Tax=Forsythia ovata TaxID=205694 RepID=A0ABD1TSY0_9LAMI